MVTPVVVVDALREVSLEGVVGTPPLLLLLGLGRLGQSGERHVGHVGSRDVNPRQLVCCRPRQVRLVLGREMVGL